MFGKKLPKREKKGGAEAVSPPLSQAAGGRAGEKFPAARPLGEKFARAKLLVSIVNRGDEVHLKEVLDDCSVSLSYLFTGTGTAHSAVLDYLGIGEATKSVLLSIFPESDEGILMKEIRHKMSLYLSGRGISFTIPLTGISQTVADGIVGAASNKNNDGGKRMTDRDRKYDLIVAAVSADYVDAAMEAARQVGAAGGTIVRARAEQNDKAEQFIGISLMREQEILFILTKREATVSIMSALSEKVGAKTLAGGVIFSVPVDRTAGISAAEEEAAEERRKNG